MKRLLIIFLLLSAGLNVGFLYMQRQSGTETTERAFPGHNPERRMKRIADLYIWFSH